MVEVKVGGYYKTRDGRTVGPARVNHVDGNDEFPFVLTRDYGGTFTVTKKGKYYSDSSECCDDLIEEIVSELPNPGDTVLVEMVVKSVAYRVVTFEEQSVNSARVKQIIKRADPPFKIGDRVSVGPNQYKILAVHNEMAWLENVQTSGTYLEKLSNLRLTNPDGSDSF